MKIYTLKYKYKKSTIYNRSLFVCPNDELAEESMKLNLMQKDAERFRNQVMEGNTILVSVGTFTEEEGLTKAEEIEICNLKELINDNNGDLAEPKQDNAK